MSIDTQVGPIPASASAARGPNRLGFSQAQYNLPCSPRYFRVRQSADIIGQVRGSGPTVMNSQEVSGVLSLCKIFGSLQRAGSSRNSRWAYDVR
ncbi:hypothetical protein FA13DRAFT_1734782 [Coprinellus micaceus]|uniref:Uncharacterized protein n=1 Tax=Coprinellus micaceus TaxID=71717 RepID=A0A4Y7T609_COPMI|nr:hypothetical protein FA13DRAFT_1734782 [Coprinellus micaceus]